MKKKALFAKLYIQDVGVTTHYGNNAVEKAEQCLRDYHNLNEHMKVYIEVTYQLS